MTRSCYIAYKEGREAYIAAPWLVDTQNPYEIETEEYVEFEKGWDDAEFSDKVKCGYFDW